MLETYTGSWSPLTLIVAVLMALSGLVLLVVLLVSGFTGRLGTRVPPSEEEPPPGDGDDALYNDEDEDAEADEASEGDDTKPASPARRKTGWWQLLAAIGCSLVSMAASLWVDNVYGPLATFTGGTALALAALAGQVFFIVWYSVLQRRL